MSTPIRILVALDAGAERDTVEAVLPGPARGGAGGRGGQPRGRLASRWPTRRSTPCSWAAPAAPTEPSRSPREWRATTPTVRAPPPCGHSQRPRGQGLGGGRRGPPRASGIERPAALSRGPRARGGRAADRASEGGGASPAGHGRPARRKGPDDRGAGPEGRGGQDARLVAAWPSRSPRRASGWCCSTSTSSSETSGSRWACRPPRPSTTSSSPAARWTPRSWPTTSSPHESGARVLQAPARPDQAAAIGVEFLRAPVRCRAGDGGLDHRRRLAGLHARDHRGDRAVDRHLHGRHG